MLLLNETCPFFSFNSVFFFRSFVRRVFAVIKLILIMLKEIFVFIRKKHDETKLNKIKENKKRIKIEKQKGNMYLIL